jgi:macrolide transport system ATP-binding/permease protein
MFVAVWRMIGRVRAFFRREALDRDFAQELESHVAMLADDNMRRGMTREEAHRTALIRLGARTSLQDQHRSARGLPTLETVLQDLRFGVRQLLKHPGFTTAAVCVFALGLAANVAIFGFVDASVIKPLPYADPSRLVTAFSTRPDRGQGEAKLLVSYLNFVEWRGRIAHSARSPRSMSALVSC